MAALAVASGSDAGSPTAGPGPCSLNKPNDQLGLRASRPAAGFKLGMITGVPGAFASGAHCRRTNASASGLRGTPNARSNSATLLFATKRSLYPHEILDHLLHPSVLHVADEAQYLRPEGPAAVSSITHRPVARPCYRPVPKHGMYGGGSDGAAAVWQLGSI
jgi:hypothetical protein